MSNILSFLQPIITDSVINPLSPCDGYKHKTHLTTEETEMKLELKKNSR